MEIQDSRRLTGPNLIGPLPGAVLDVSLPQDGAARLLEAWSRCARGLLDAVGWGAFETAVRRFSDGASLLISAPIDALYAATEVNEAAFASACAVLQEGRSPRLEEVASRLRQLIDAERNPPLLALREEARARSVAFFSDDELASVGIGKGSRCWPVTNLPAPAEVDWDRIFDVPVILVTGTNGKTTTVRLLAAITEAAGLCPGLTSTDGIRVGEVEMEAGDWSGPGGARRVARDPRVEIALLETARGGLLRRGLGVSRAGSAGVLNVAADHLGEFGVGDVGELADVKLVVTRALGAGDALVVNAEDAELVRALKRLQGDGGLTTGAGGDLRASLLWFGTDPGDEVIQTHLGRGGRACIVDGEWLTLAAGRQRTRLAPVGEVPVTLGGLARHNVSNALAAAGLALAAGLSADAVGGGLRALAGTTDDNPGRGNVRVVGGVRILIDFAHNPHGMTALCDTVAAMPAERRLVLLSQAGDRDDEAIRELARIVWNLAPSRVVVADLPAYLRGRRPGEVPELLATELMRLGAPPDRIVRSATEADGVGESLRWARPGDLLLLPLHADRQDAFDLLSLLERCGWSAGEPLPW